VQGEPRPRDSGLWAIDVVHGPVEVVLTVTKVKRVVIDAPQVVTPHTVEEWTRLLEALASRLDHRTHPLPVGCPAVAELVSSLSRRWS
jgi:hypothetical protein